MKITGVVKITGVRPGHGGDRGPGRWEGEPAESRDLSKQ